MKGRKSKSNRRIKFRNFIACLTAMSVLMGSTYFVMADTPDPVYICGMEEHAHTGEKGDCYETKLVCGKIENIVYECPKGGPHEHSDDNNCYKYSEPYLNCGVKDEDQGHVHGDDCYAVVAELICTEATEAAHEHDNDCATDEEGTLVCEKTVDVIHEHSDNCYGTKTVLKCGIIKENHFHDDNCYKRDKNLVCKLDEHECTHDECWVPASDGEHKHSDACYGRVRVCTMEEHKHVDECIQPEEVTEMLEMVDALNKTALLFVEAEDLHAAKALEFTKIEAERDAAIAAGASQEEIDAIQEKYQKAKAEKAEALDVMAKAEVLFNDEWSILIAKYEVMLEAHPEYKEMIPEKQRDLIEYGVPYDTVEPVQEEVAMFAISRESLGTPIATASADDVYIKLFNYNGTINNYITDLPMTFYNYSSNSVDGKGTVESGKTIYDYEVNPTLGGDDFPAIRPWGSAASTEYKSMSTLFPVVGKTLPSYLTAGGYVSLEDGGGLFTKDARGYHFDSKVQAAEVGTDGFTVYDAQILPRNASGEDAENGHFLPFNDHAKTEKYIDDVPSDKRYIVDDDTETDMWFGMTMDFWFRMPKDGMIEVPGASGGIKEEAMKFRFCGDDDVMVFIDGKLAINLTGCHKEEEAIIDFSDGTVNVRMRDPLGSGSRHEKPLPGGNNPTENDYTETGNIFKTTETVKDDNGNETTKTVIKPFATNSLHRLQFFYLERGGGCSNCAIDFNLPAVAKNSLTVAKNVDTNSEDVATGNVVGVGAQEYEFRVMDAAGNVLITEGTRYTLKNGETVVKPEGWKESDGEPTFKVGPGGYFKLRDGQSAVFKDMHEYKKNYYVEEVLPTDYVDAYNKVIYRASSEGGTEEHDGVVDTFGGIRTETLEYDETHIVTFNNRVDVQKLGRLHITKTARDNLTGTFDIKVMQVKIAEDGNLIRLVPVAKGTPFKVVNPVVTTANDNSRTVGNDGIIKLRHGDTAIFDNILPGTTYEITEPYAQRDGYFGTFTTVDEETGEPVTSSKAVVTVPVYKETVEEVKGEDGKVKEVKTDTTVKVDILNRATNFVLNVPLAKTVDGLPLKQAFKDDFTFEVYEVTQADGKYIPTKFSDNTKIEFDVAAKDAKTDRATEKGELKLKFDKDRPNGVYTFEVVEKNPNTDPKNPKYEENTQVFTIQVEIDQSQNGNERAKIVKMRAGKAEAVNGVLGALKGLISSELKEVHFVNHRIPQPIDVTVEKVWKMTTPGVTEHPDSVQVQLYVNGTPVSEANGGIVTLNEANEWNHTWKGVVTDVQQWMVEEIEVPDGFTVTYGTNHREPNKIYVNNETWSKVPGGGGGGGGERGDLTITKVIREDSTAAFKEGATFNMVVELDGVQLTKGVEYKLNGNKRTVGEDGMIAMKAGEEVVIEDILAGTEYSVREAVPSGSNFFATYGGKATGTIEADETASVVVTNQTNDFGLNIDLDKQVVGLKPGDNYTFAFDLKLVEVNGKEVVDGYTDTKSITVAGPEVVEPEGDIMPSMVEDDVEEVPVKGATFELNFNKTTPAGTYVYEVTERPVDLSVFRANNQKFVVTVVVDHSAAQRATITSVTENDETVDNVTFTNTTLEASEKQLVTVHKTWVSDAEYPASVKVQLDVTLDGELKTYEKVLTNGDWTAAWTIDKDATWTVKETEVVVDGKTYTTADEGKTWTAEGEKVYYTTTVNTVEKEETGDEEVTITNTRVVPETPKQIITVRKEWKDIPEDYTIPKSVDVELNAITEDGTIKERVTLSEEANDWEYVWTIPKAAVWSVSEVSVDGYTTENAGKTWTSDSTEVYYTTTTEKVATQDGTGFDVTITNAYVLPEAPGGNGGGGNGGGGNSGGGNSGGGSGDGDGDGMVLGATDENKPEEDGMVLGAYDDAEEEIPLIAGVADTGDNKIIIAAAAVMAAAIAGILALRKRKED